MSTENNKLTKAISSAVSESLENMVFKTTSALELVWGKVAILAPFQGALTIAFPEKTLSNLTGEMYTQKLSPKEQKAAYMDTVAEMANIIAGRMMSSLVHDDIEFNLALPETGIGTIEGAQEGYYIQHYEMDGSIYLIVLEGQALLAHKKEDVTSTKLFEEDAWGS